MVKFYMSLTMETPQPFRVPVAMFDCSHVKIHFSFIYLEFPILQFMSITSFFTWP